jgi:hypothetical protein
MFLALKPDNSDDILEELPKFLLKHPVSTIHDLPNIEISETHKYTTSCSAEIIVTFLKDSHF